MLYVFFIKNFEEKNINSKKILKYYKKIYLKYIYDISFC